MTDTMMRKIAKLIRRIFICVVLLLLAFLILVYAYNRIMLMKEEPLMEHLYGEMVTVEGHQMCVYSEGEGEHTLVFLAGSGTASPVLDFKPLYTRLSRDYRIVVLEKFGYGFSDIVDDERTFDTILREDREALSKLGIDGSYILCSHSMSALEAILWAQQYPDEVEAIIGLDMALPSTYAELDLHRVAKLAKAGAFARELGLVRLFYHDANLSPELSADDKRLYRAIASRIAVNKDVRNESQHIYEACEEIERAPLPDIPQLLFVSNGKEVGVKDWKQLQHNYANALTHGSVVELDCGHYVHDFAYEQIAEESRAFIESL